MTAFLFRFELLGIEDNQENSVDKITEIPIDCLYGFKNHPFHVINDEKMQETVDSIKEYGVLNPCILSTVSRYNLISTIFSWSDNARI